nr:PREDICTED: uncharacterized protein LOC106703844 [Latimeria chalumnae]|eukprot:XP_014344962.1 PREDICTED: uncharacterized protein LOC106703844 [Latimeria chalumnae]
MPEVESKTAVNHFTIMQRMFSPESDSGFGCSDPSRLTTASPQVDCSHEGVERNASFVEGGPPTVKPAKSFSLSTASKASHRPIGNMMGFDAKELTNMLQLADLSGLSAPYIQIHSDASLNDSIGQQRSAVHDSDIFYHDCSEDCLLLPTVVQSATNTSKQRITYWTKRSKEHSRPWSDNISKEATLTLQNEEPRPKQLLEGNIPWTPQRSEIVNVLDSTHRYDQPTRTRSHSYNRPKSNRLKNVEELTSGFKNHKSARCIWKKIEDQDSSYPEWSKDYSYFSPRRIPSKELDCEDTIFSCPVCGNESLKSTLLSAQPVTDDDDFYGFCLKKLCWFVKNEKNYQSSFVGCSY